ncbi:Cls Phosphatidylserine/phosphatidylglycerophosphate/ cardiolipin synthases and related enzymes [Oxalobacteraceae bacterium]
MLLDAQIYFRAVRAAIRQARRCIFVLSWDIDSRIWLVPEGAEDGYPEPLGDFLHAVVAERRELNAYVLNWDFTMLYAMEREWLPAYHLGWRTHQRLHFLMDGRHPVGACHHQKVIVIDDTLAFVGGLDLTSARWDTPAHSAADGRRRDVNGNTYAPFHDVQAAVDGDAARALGMLCRDRWRLAGGSETVSPTQSGMNMWPDCLDTDLNDVPVAISRTVPAYDGMRGVSEIRQLHLDAIASAHEGLLFENQYFTSGLIAEALALRLAEPLGPEVLIISPNRQSGWLEEATMGVLRARMHDRLRRADIYHHYRMMSPQLDELDGGALNVHSKVFFVDDRLLCIGSANLSNRSMACDTECNLCIEAGGDEHERLRIAAAIARMRARLLAEHLAEVPELVQKVFSEKGLLGATKHLSQRPRRLVELDPLAPPELDALIPQQSLFDPEEPIDPEALIARLVPRESREPLARRFVVMVMLSLLLIAGVIAVRYTPLQAHLNLQAMILLASELRELTLAPLWIMLAFVIGGLLMVPVTLLIAVTGVVFGTFPGAWYALAGSVLSAATGYLLGAMLGRDTVRRMMGERIRRLSLRIARRGVIAMIIVRTLPLAPYSVVNIVAGASHIRQSDFLVGTMVGMLPGIFLTTTFAEHLVTAIHQPSPQTLGMLMIVVLLLIALAFTTARMIRRQQIYR